MEKRRIINYRPIVFCFLAMAFGIATILLSDFNRLYVSLLFCLTIITLIIFTFKIKRFGKYIIVPIFLLFGIVAGTFYGELNVDGRVHYDKASIKGRVCEIRSYGAVIEDVEAAGSKLKGKAILFNSKKFEIGDLVYAYDDISTYTIDTDDGFVISLIDDNILHYSESDSFGKIGETKLKINEKIKLKTKEIFDKYLKSDSADIAYGMLFGDTSLMDFDLKGELSKTGLNHIFAVSGLHIGFLAGMIIWINKKLKIKRWFNVFATTLVLVCYNMLCGYSPSMIRATVMMLILLAGRELGYKNDGLSRLCFAGLIIIIFNPISLFTVSFQMSFAAVFGILAFSPYFIKKLNRIPKWSAELAGLSLGVNIAIFPILCYYFNSFAILFLPVNMLIMPLMPIIYACLIMLTVLNLIFPYVAFVLPLDYLFAPIKLVTLAVGQLSFSVIEIAFGKLSLYTYLTCEAVISPYLLIKKSVKAKIIVILILLYTAFTVLSII